MQQILPDPAAGERFTGDRSAQGDVVAVGLRAELDVGPAELSLMFSSNQTRVGKT